ncbi:hypothetical protein QJS10_CPB21g01558 [Acorus calamus]|uniref:Uncharacterized protein n=1 Tax=Acorus calamus TaxID=4465 RepID=A0AAV9C2X5_ACOCL|nr:hypothetical protein QJS10_CPB21g01558 [Acorus calamus]
MCPLRVLLIFISATLAGFFVLRNLRSDPDVDADDVDGGDRSSSAGEGSTGVRSAMRRGFWTCVDMATGKYLWRKGLKNKYDFQGTWRLERFSPVGD